MAGISDSPYRLLCRRFGAGFSFTEFVSSDALSHGSQKSLAMFRFEPEERPVIFQIFGKDESVIVNAARIAESLRPDVLDLNMGCSVNKVAMKGAGAGLLRDPVKAGRIIQSLRRSLGIPVTAKIRLGWDDSSRNYRDVARILEDAGVAMLSVHGRTRAQAYKGRADWDAIGEIKNLVSIPVLGNGDVQSHGEALERKRDYGVDGVLVGRGAIGNPWLFSGRDKDGIALAELLDVMLAHLGVMEEFYESGVILFRKHAARYLHGFPGARALRSRMMAAEGAAEAEDVCREFQETYRSDPEYAEHSAPAGVGRER